MKIALMVAFLIALPYLPWFSNCDGYDAHVLISKLLEGHPDCALVPPERTVYVDPMPWKNMMVAVPYLE